VVAVRLGGSEMFHVEQSAGGKVKGKVFGFWE